MKRAVLLASSALLIGATTPDPAPTPEAAPASAIATPQLAAARLPGFAAALAQQPSIKGEDGWAATPDIWNILSQARGVDRQQARWDYARGLIGQERGAEALGVLDVMRQDDPDLGMVDSYRLARGAALILLDRLEEASSELSAASLSTNAEACVWRVRALAESGMAEQALQQMRCAAPAFTGVARPKFRLAAARAAVEGGQPALAIAWLNRLPDRDPAANLYRGRAELAMGKPDQARLRFARVEQSGAIPLKMDARLSEIEAEVANGSLDGPAALKRLGALRYAWRGDAIEERALQLSYKLSVDGNDLGGALSAGATLFRFYDVSRQSPEFLSGLQARLSEALDPARKLPVERAAGLYWNYRDLSPSGAAGDLLVSQLASRLQVAGYYGRAADLLEYQLFNRAVDLARGPLSAKVAALHVLAGRPDRALDVLRRSADPSFPDGMVYDRKRVNAVALAQLGRVPEAFAELEGVPGAAGLRGEILWRRRDWQGLVGEGANGLPPAGSLAEVDQAIVLRHAISLAMLGQEDRIVALRDRYRASFQGLPTAAVFDMLTASPAAADPEMLSRAMAAMPGVSPAGDLATLLDQRPAKQ